VLRDRVLLKAGLTEEEVREEYRKARTFVLPSLEGPSGTEGFGIVLLEAMSYAVPIVASATGGIVEVLDNGSCGLLVEPGNPDALARALLSLWNNTSLGDQLSSKAFHRLIKYYVWNT
jgi:glycosyltransferase involved in cell wall biosynthesis